ncbi:hypothetical protein [Thiothrix subterranea]|uniref:hypothetical protein n=1 Tax=Thiothrix subterranea TaxID=2735563 RepID=UPI00280ACA9F|nr:hypothetical protein [Thiothrix subterranea]
MLHKRDKCLSALFITGVTCLFSSMAHAAYEYNLTPPASTLTQEIFDLHMLTTIVWHHHYGAGDGHDYLRTD